MRKNVKQTAIVVVVLALLIIGGLSVFGTNLRALFALASHAIPGDLSDGPRPRSEGAREYTGKKTLREFARGPID